MRLIEGNRAKRRQVPDVADDHQYWENRRHNEALKYLQRKPADAAPNDGPQTAASARPEIVISPTCSGPSA